MHLAQVFVDRGVSCPPDIRRKLVLLKDRTSRPKPVEDGGKKENRLNSQQILSEFNLKEISQSFNAP